MASKVNRKSEVSSKANCNDSKLIILFTEVLVQVLQNLQIIVIRRIVMQEATRVKNKPRVWIALRQSLNLSGELGIILISMVAGHSTSLSDKSRNAKLTISQSVFLGQNRFQIVDETVILIHFYRIKALIGVKTLRKHIKIESSNYTMFLPHFY